MWTRQSRSTKISQAYLSESLSVYNRAPKPRRRRAFCNSNETLYKLLFTRKQFVSDGYLELMERMQPFARRDFDEAWSQLIFKDVKL